MLSPAPEWSCTIRVLFYIQANDTSPAAAPRPFRSDPGKIWTRGKCKMVITRKKHRRNLSYEDAATLSEFWEMAAQFD